MARIRVFAEDDVPAAAALFARVYPEHRWSSPAACEAYFREMLFNNPWRDLQLPSWVAEEDGRVCGCYAVMPRSMLFRGRRIRVAVLCQVIVDPDQRHSLTVLQLAKACLSGPQDLTLADGANDKARRMWIGIGGTVPLLHSLHWTRPLRPARYVLALLDKPGRRRRLLRAARAPCMLVDAVAARLHRNGFVSSDDGLEDQPLDATRMFAHVDAIADRNGALRPLYDEHSLGWLLEQAALKARHGRLRARSVIERGKLLGWFIYYARAGEVNEVLQLAALGGSYPRVLQRLLVDAWRQGATALRGRFDPHHVQELCDRHCWFRREGPWTLVHSRHSDVLAALESGAAGLSRLDGEWWLRFIGG